MAEYEITLAAEDQRRWDLMLVAEPVEVTSRVRIHSERLVDGFIPLIERRMTYDIPVVNTHDTYVPSWTYDEPKLQVIGFGWGNEQERKERFLEEVRAAKEYERKMKILFDSIGKYLSTRFVNVDNIPQMFKRDPYDSPMFRFVKGGCAQSYVALEGKIKEIPEVNLKHFVYAVMADQISCDLNVQNEGNKGRAKRRKELERLLEKNEGIINTIEHELKPFSVCVHDYLQYFLGRFVGLSEYDEFVNRSRYNPSLPTEEWFNEHKGHYLDEYRMAIIPHRQLLLRGVSTDEENRAYLLETVTQVGNLLEKRGFKIGVKD
ncbi:hypothetical protein J4437_01325 [Candidatus Woesearchaeota archaeon]|nr:hypothetical protein [Candidatus Woesearchaeota archaeon]